MIKIPEKYLKPLDYLYVLRPSLFFAVWIIVLAGYEASNLFFTGESTWFSLNVNIELIIYFILITLATGSTFIYNQLKDVESDKENKKCFLISENHISPDIAKRYALFLSIVPLIILFFMDFRLSILVVLVEFLWGYLYNFAPFRWKDKPIMGVIANLIGGLLLFLIGWKMNNPIKMEAFYRFIPYLCAWGAVSILTTIPDMQGDELQTKKTIAIWIGRRSTVWVTLIMVIAGFVTGMRLDDPVITHAILLSFPLYIITAFKPTQAWVLRTIRYSILFLAIFLSIEYPYFLITLGLNYYISKFYYINRFNLNYPTFTILDDEEDDDNN